MSVTLLGGVIGVLLGLIGLLTLELGFTRIANLLWRGIRALWRLIVPPAGTDYLPGGLAKQLPEDVRRGMSADQAPR